MKNMPPQIVGGEVSDVNYHFMQNAHGVYDLNIDIETIKKVNFICFDEI
jgi:hypothetical protein